MKALRLEDLSLHRYIKNNALQDFIEEEKNILLSYVIEESSSGSYIYQAQSDMLPLPTSKGRGWVYLDNPNDIIEQTSSGTIAVYDSEYDIIDPSDYDADNSILVANGRRKHVFTVNGWCTIAHRAIYVAALRNSTKVYPVIYPGAGSTNIIETNAYYYIRALTGNFQKGNDTFWFDITFIYGGS